MRPVQKLLMTILWALTVLIMVSVIGAGLWRRGERELPVLAEVPPFELTNQDAKPVTLASLRGRPWVADFVFTRCAGPCPTMTATMASLQKRIERSSGVRLVSFTSDPANDTPEVLKEYGSRFGADAARWDFLTGPADTIYATSRGLLLALRPATDASPIIHSEKFVLVDADGKVRQYYDSGDPRQVDQLIKDAADLAEDAGGAAR